MHRKRVPNSHLTDTLPPVLTEHHRPPPGPLARGVSRGPPGTPAPPLLPPGGAVPGGAAAAGAPTLLPRLLAGVVAGGVRQGVVLGVVHAGNGDTPAVHPPVHTVLQKPGVGLTFQ